MAIEEFLLDVTQGATPFGFDEPKRRKRERVMTTRVGEVKRAQNTPEGTFVKVLDDVPDSELTVGDEGIVQDGPEGGKLLITEEIDIPLALNPATPLEIISVNVDSRPAVTPTRTPEEFQQEFEADFSEGVTEEEQQRGAQRLPGEAPLPQDDERALSAEEETEMGELFEMPEQEMSLARQTRLSRLGARARQFGMAATSFGKGVFDLGSAVGQTIEQKVAVEQEISDRAAGRRSREGVRREFEEEALTRVGEVGLRAGSGALRATGAASESAARFLRRATGAQVRLEGVPAGISVKFEQSDPNADLVIGDVGVVGFGVRRGQRRVLIPSTGEVLTPRQGIQVTVLGESGIRFRVEKDGTVTQRAVGASERIRDDFSRRSSRPISTAFRDDQLEDFFTQPRRPRSAVVPPASFSVASVRGTKRPQRPFTPSEGQPTFRELQHGKEEQFGTMPLFSEDLREERMPHKAKIFPEIEVFGTSERLLDF